MKLLYRIFINGELIGKLINDIQQVIKGDIANHII